MVARAMAANSAPSPAPLRAPGDAHGLCPHRRGVHRARPGGGRSCDARPAHPRMVAASVGSRSANGRILRASDLFEVEILRASGRFGAKFLHAEAGFRATRRSNLAPLRAQRRDIAGAIFVAEAVDFHRRSIAEARNFRHRGARFSSPRRAISVAGARDFRRRSGRNSRRAAPPAGLEDAEIGFAKAMNRRELFVSFSGPSNGHFLH